MRVHVRCPDPSATRWITGSVRSAGFDLALTPEEAAVVVLWPGEGPQARGDKTIAVLPVARDHGLHFEAGADRWSTLMADAYCSDPADLDAALHFVLREDEGGRRKGPLRITWLGTLGEADLGHIAVGTSWALSADVLIGRAREADVWVRQGPHSDQNRCARRHARVSAVDGVAVIEDLASANGTWVNGAPIRRPRALSASDQVALCGTMRLRVDGV